MTAVEAGSSAGGSGLAVDPAFCAADKNFDPG